MYCFRERRTSIAALGSAALFLRLKSGGGEIAAAFIATSVALTDSTHSDAAKAVALYEVTTFPPQMQDMSALIVECARITEEAIPLLRSLNLNAARLHDLTERLVTLEGHADILHEDGLKLLYAQARDGNPMDFIVGREIYSHLEKVTDRFEDVANEISGLVIDHA